MPAGPEADASAQAQTDSVVFDTFSGLRNTVSPERLGPRELGRARNVDVDDAGELHRRRGSRKALAGRFHSLHQTAGGVVVAVRDGVLCRVNPDYTLVRILDGIGPAPLAYVDVGRTLYFSSLLNSGKVDLVTLDVQPWGRIVDHSYQPGLEPAPEDWWYSPNPTPEDGFGPIAGRLFGPPPPASCLAARNGRIYLGAGPVLWATELYLYDFVDRTKGYRQFESDITCLGDVADGLYVGTRTGLYFAQGRYGEEQLTLREAGAVVPGTMVACPGEILSPEGRRRPDIPQGNEPGLICMTENGAVVCLPGGNTYNLTRTSFRFPQAVRGASIFKDQDGLAQVVTTLDSGGTPRDNARFGDHIDATIIRANGKIEGAGPVPAPLPAGLPPKPPRDRVRFVDLAGNELFEGIEDD